MTAPLFPKMNKKEFAGAIDSARETLHGKQARLDRLQDAREVLIYSYGARGSDLALQLRSRGVSCIVFDNSLAARERARQDGFDTTEDIPFDLPVIVAAGQSQKQIFSSLGRDAYSLVESLYSLNLRNSHGPAREFTAVVLTRVDELFEQYERITPSCRAAFVDVLLYRASLDVHGLKANRSVRDMWNPPVRGFEIRSFCDVGAANGDTLASTKMIFPELTRSFTIEPDPSLSPFIAKAAQEHGIDNTNHIGAAWSRKARLSATTRSGMMVVAEDPNGTISGDALDDLAGEKTYDYLKFDVEGSEAEALRGARRLLQKSRLVAVASYHLPGDILGLPALLSEILETRGSDSEWQLAFCHYSECFDDSIFYHFRPAFARSAEYSLSIRAPTSPA